MIHSIDDLKTASDREIRAAGETLNLKGRVSAGLQRRATAVGMTKAEYMAELAKIEEEEVSCKHCNGTGRWRRKKPRTIGVIHPSSADACVLRLYYDVTGEFAPRTSFKPAHIVTFQIGHAIHDLTQEILSEDFGDRFEPEKRIQIGSLVAGNTDGLVTMDEVRAVLEIKSIGSEWATLKEPLGEHRIQAGGLYATALDAPFTVYLYISKAWPHDIKEFVEVYDPGVFRRWARTKGERVQEAVDKNDPPIADASPSECAECPYSKDCPQRLDKKGGKTFQVKR